MRTSAAVAASAVLLLAFAAAGARAQDPAPPETPRALPAPGYVFSQPRLLTQQLLWGLAHGVRLLAVTCRTLENGDAAAIAYLEWMERHRERIGRATRDIARHYFRRDDASYDALAAAMNLRPMLSHAPEELGPACDSLPQALKAERYDLDRFYSLHRDAARVERAESIRGLVRRCRADGDPSAADDAFAAWEADNISIELAALDRLSGGSGDAAADAKWRREIGQGAVLTGVSCGSLPALLSSPGYGLLQVFGGDDE